MCLQELNQPERAVVHYDELFKRKPNPFVAYELAELTTQLNKLDEAAKHIEYGYANSSDDVMRTFTEGQETKVEYTFGYVMDKDGNLRINLHHSSIPFSG